MGVQRGGRRGRGRETGTARTARPSSVLKSFSIDLSLAGHNEWSSCVVCSRSWLYDNAFLGRKELPRDSPCIGRNSATTAVSVSLFCSPASQLATTRPDPGSVNIDSTQAVPGIKKEGLKEQCSRGAARVCAITSLLATGGRSSGGNLRSIPASFSRERRPAGMP